MFSDAEIAFLRELNRARVDFLVVGLSAAALQGAPVVTQDVDLWFRDLSDPGIRKALRKVGGAYVAPAGSQPPMFAGRTVNLFDIVVHMHGLGGFEEEQKRAKAVRAGTVTLRVLGLDRIIASKKAAGRPKDRLAIPVLRDALRALSAAPPPEERWIPVKRQRVTAHVPKERDI